MAQRVVTLLVDDLDGESEAVETVPFGLDGAQYEIDLTEEHAQELRQAAAPFLAAARRVGRGTPAAPRRRSTPADSNGPNLAAVRAWARENDLQVSDRGRVSGSVLQAYEDAH